MIAIVGSGVTGLTTAYLLLKQGVPVTVYEAGSAEGGLAATFTREGFAFDYGPHELCTDNQALLDLLAEVNGDDLLTVEKNIAQFFNGRYVRYPFEIVDVLRNVSPLLWSRAMVEVGWSQLRNSIRPPTDDSFEAWTTSRFGRTLYQTYFGPYTSKVWGIAPSLLDPRTASDRITVDSIWDLIRKTIGYQVLGFEEHRRTHSELRRSFLYTRGGIGTLQANLRRRVEEFGGRFEFGKRLVGVVDGDLGVEELVFDDGSRARGFSSVVSTIPLPHLVRIVLGERAEPLIRDNQLPFRGMIFVFLRVDRPRVNDYHWTYYPDIDVPFQRATEFAHFGADMSPPGRTGLALEVANNPSDVMWGKPDAEVVDICVHRLENLGLLAREDVLGFDVQRVRHAYPVQVIGFQEKVDRLLAELQQVANVVSIGRQGLFRYCNMNECMEMALDVVPRLIAGESSIRCLARGSWRGVALTDREWIPQRRGDRARGVTGGA